MLILSGEIKCMSGTGQIYVDQRKKGVLALGELKTLILLQDSDWSGALHFKLSMGTMDVSPLS